MRSHLIKALVATVVGVLLVPLAGINWPANAAVGAPALTSPAAGATVTANAELTWASLLGAKKYDVQLASTSDFSSGLEFSQSTLNTTATPPNDLGVGTHYWRVRAYDSANVAGAFSITRSFDKGYADAPTVLQPPDGDACVPGCPLGYSVDPLVLSWAPMPGIKTYEVQIDDDAAFVGAPAPTLTNNTSFTPPNPPLGTRFYWHVRGKSSQGVPTQYSAPRSYKMTWDADPGQISPENVESPTIEEIVLKWEAMPGASAYQLQISPDVEFNAPIGGTRVVNGTSFAPSVTLPGGSYYWRVRGLSTSSTPEPSNWSDTWVFTRAWPAGNPSTRPLGTQDNAFSQVTLMSPVDGDYTLRQPTFSWTPQREATRYEFQISTEPNFPRTSPPTTWRCWTNHTTFTSYRLTPTSQPLCAAVAGQVNYWRVRAVDSPSDTPTNPPPEDNPQVPTDPTVYGVFSAPRSFLYDATPDGGAVVQLSPPDGSTVALPVLTWEPVAAVAKYKVTIDPSDPLCPTITANTYNRTYVPETLRSTCTGTFAWTVQVYEANGSLSTLPSAGPWEFSLAPGAAGTALEPVATTWNSAHHDRPPLMTWQPLTGALSYSVWASVHGASSYVKMHTTTTQPGFAYTGFNTVLNPLLPPGEYDFKVRAYSDVAGTTFLGESQVHSFITVPLPTTVLTSPGNCPLETQNCPVRHDTPTLEWEPVRTAVSYLVYLSTDPDFTNITRTWKTLFSSLTPVESLPDSQAGQATYWFVRPCYDAGATVCGAFDNTVFGDAYAFRKRSFSVAPVSPLAGSPPVEDEVTFTWQDYLKTNQGQQGASEVVTQEARNYRVQVSTTAEFTNIIDTSPLVDQTRYEAQTTTYPDGPLFWRVQAYDGNDNPLTFSEDPTFSGRPIEFEKKSPGPNLTKPLADAVVSSAPELKWAAKTFAETYEVEVYKNPGSPLSVANRVVSISTRASAAIPTTPLAPGEYGWRVRRLDTNGLPGAWTADNDKTPMRRFTVRPGEPSLSSPTNGRVVPNNNVVLRWTSPDGSVPGVPSLAATRYRVEVSLDVGFLTTLDSVTTDMTSWAPGLVSPAWPNQTIYWRVKALDANGQLLTTSATGSFVKDASTSGEFTAISPYRLLDTRITKNPMGTKATRMFDVTGGLNTGIPASGVSAVVMNVTVTAPTAAGSLTVYPYDVARPTSSNLSFVAGQTVPNLVKVGVNTNGWVNLYNSAGTSHVILDIVGYYSGGTLQRATRFVAAGSPTRILDTRGGSGQPARPLRAAEARTVTVEGLGGVPAGATSAVINVTAVTPSAAGYLTVYPAGVSRPMASNLNFVRNVTVPNLVSVRLGSGGDVTLFNSAGVTNVLFDVVGWYVGGDPGAGSRFSPLSSPLALDTRLAGSGGKLVANASRGVQIRGLRGVPNSLSVVSVVLIVTVTQPDAAGYAIVYPSGTTVPTASNLNYTRGKTISNLVVVKVGTDGKINLRSNVSTHATVAVAGWFGG